MSYDFLLTIAIVMLFTKIFGLTSERVHMPQVVGALVAGVLVGPSVLGWVGETDFLVKAAEIGVIILMFNAGLDTDMEELKKRIEFAGDLGIDKVITSTGIDKDRIRVLHHCTGGCNCAAGWRDGLLSSVRKRPLGFA